MGGGKRRGARSHCVERTVSPAKFDRTYRERCSVTMLDKNDLIGAQKNPGIVKHPSSLAPGFLSASL